jgi:hypothetical protein
MVEDIANLVRPDRVPYQERTLPAQPALLEAREQLMQRIAFRLRRICRHSGFGSAQRPWPMICFRWHPSAASRVRIAGMASVRIPMGGLRAVHSDGRRCNSVAGQMPERNVG